MFRASQNLLCASESQIMTDAEIDDLCELELANALERIRANGPDRVVINRQGVGIPAADAVRNGILSDVVFVRNDGWSLGAPAALERIAKGQWLTFWIARYDPATHEVVRFDKTAF